MKPKVSVIVVTKNEEMNIINCLISIFAQDYSKDAYEVILVDAGSEDNTRGIAQRFPVRLIVDANGTLGHQRNTGVRLSEGEYVAFIDADCRADANWLAQLVDVMDKSPSEVAAVTGPNLIVDSDPPLAKTIAFMQQTLIGSGGSPQSYPVRGRLASVISVPNCNAIYRRQVLLEHPYDESFVCGEDAEVNYRLYQKGYKFLYNPCAVVWHHRVSTIRALIRKMFVWGFAMAQIIKKHKRPVRWYAWLPPALMLFLAALPFFMLLNISYKWAYGILISYALVVAIATVQVFTRQRNVYALCAAFLLPVQHISYGLGMLLGLLSGYKGYKKENY